MAKSAKTTLIEYFSRPGMQIFEFVLGIAAFCSLYLTLISALPFNAAYYCALPVGAAVSAVLLVFSKHKLIRHGVIIGLIVFTILAITAGFGPFGNGMYGFLNGAIKKINAVRHSGYGYFAAQGGFGADFLFMTVIAVWIAAFSSIAVRESYVFICVAACLVFGQLYIGLYPQYYVAILIVLVFVCLLAVRSGFNLRSACCYLACAVAVTAAGIPCYLFNGSEAIDRIGKSFSTSWGNAVYGNSLPSGKLNDSYGMRSSESVRLRITMSPLTPSFYLKGFVGIELNGTEWSTVDKNIYVENGYQGLLDYIAEGGLPVTQYAAYSELCQRNNKYDLTVENVSADRRYVYAPYTLTEYSEGSAYYDTGLRGGVLTPRTYTHTVFAADASSERITQAEWLMQDINRTAAMDEYIKLEGQYRAFVYDSYLTLDEGTASAVNNAVGDFKTDSINTATQFIRSYFLDGFTYEDECDLIEGSFAEEFFGGKIERANAAYFATAATCMFRALGFAARYVEGYSVYAYDYTSESDTLTVEVTGDSTHAWTEVYFDGIGWLPIEVTPTFFTERAPDVMIDPSDPSDTENPPAESDSQPEVPTDEPNIPDVPDVPKPVRPEQPETENTGLIIALRVLVPFVSVILVILAIILLFVLRRIIIRLKRRKKLSGGGEEFGHAAYDIIVHDCKRFGGFSEKNLERFGIPENGTARFMRIIERSVYGGKPIEENDRKFVLWYIETVQQSFMADCGLLRTLYCKYILCLVI